MSEIKDGGEAFPRAGFASIDHQHIDQGATGMSLRDYFAGQALAGYLYDHTHHKHSEDHIARCAYILADAMLKAREAGNEL